MRQVIKIVLQSLAALIMLPFTLIFFLLALLGGKDEAISSMSQLLSLLPGKIGAYLRAGFYRFTLKQFHPSVFIGFGTVFSQADIEISEGVYIGPQCNIGLCSIGKDTLIGSGVHIMSGKKQHNFDNPDVPIRDQGGHFEKITIGENCWLGNCALLMASVGDRCVVAAGAVVAQEFDGNVLIAGNPGQQLKTL
ncbi:acyltransferase [Glaciecola siphonariae]|uniref:Acyltransferase n=1 Tax=Glaciecola siphonariae TaxID=521012 RepID=A0ABV9LUF9_9ALTE